MSFRSLIEHRAHRAPCMPIMISSCRTRHAFFLFVELHSIDNVLLHFSPHSDSGLLFCSYYLLCRSSVSQKRKLEMDFLLEGNKRSTHVLNAVSPAFTCSAPFASYVCDHVFKNYKC